MIFGGILTLVLDYLLITV